MSDEEAGGLSEWHRARKDAISELADVSGVGTGTAGKLFEADYTSIQDLREADQEDLAEVDAIGRALAARIKADVGDSRSESSVTASSTDDADVGDPEGAVRYLVIEMPDGQRYKHTYETDPDNHARYEATVSACGQWKRDNDLAIVNGVEEIAQQEAKVIDEGEYPGESCEYDVYVEHYTSDEPTPADDVHVEGGELVMEHGPGDETRVNIVESLDEIEPVSDETIEELRELYPSIDTNDEDRIEELDHSYDNPVDPEEIVEELGEIIKGEKPYEGPLSEYVDDPETEHAFGDARIAELVEE